MSRVITSSPSSFQQPYYPIFTVNVVNTAQQKIKLNLGAAYLPFLPSRSLFAFDNSAHRLELFEKNINLYGVSCEVDLSCFLALDPDTEPLNQVQFLLLDPPNSLSGFVSPHINIPLAYDYNRTPERLRSLSALQTRFLCHAFKFPSVKRIVYTTGSVEVLENENVIKEALERHPGVFKVVHAFPEWHVRGDPDFEFGKLCVRTHPREDLTFGVFVAVLERIGNAPDPVEKFSADVTERVGKLPFDLEVNVSDFSNEETERSKFRKSGKRRRQRCNAPDPVEKFSPDVTERVGKLPFDLEVNVADFSNEETERSKIRKSGKGRRQKRRALEESSTFESVNRKVKDDSIQQQRANKKWKSGNRKAGCLTTSGDDQEVYFPAKQNRAEEKFKRQGTKERKIVTTELEKKMRKSGGISRTTGGDDGKHFEGRTRQREAKKKFKKKKEQLV